MDIFCFIIRPLEIVKENIWDRQQILLLCRQGNSFLVGNSKNGEHLWELICPDSTGMNEWTIGKIPKLGGSH